MSDEKKSLEQLKQEMYDARCEFTRSFGYAASMNVDDDGYWEAVRRFTRARTILDYAEIALRAVEPRSLDVPS